MTRAELMKNYGTQIVGGVTPGKGGQEVVGVPVFDTVQEAWEALGPIDVSVLFIPAPLVKSAAMEAIEAGVKLLVIVPDRVPIYDVLTIAALANERDARFVGPNTLGVLSPGQGGRRHDGRPGSQCSGVVLPGAGGDLLTQWRNNLLNGLLPGPRGNRCHHLGPCGR